MRSLPDMPHLGMLRRQAKELLGALRETTPSVSLSDAQRVLAQSYGCADWAALRAEVDARRADPPAAPDGFGDALAAAFGLGEVRAVEPVELTPRGRVWSLVTSEGRWAADPGYDWMTPELAETGARLQQRATAAGVATPAPRRSVDGALVARVDGGVWSVSSWRETGPAPMVPVRSALARRVGQVTATLHGLRVPSEEPIHPYLTWRRSRTEWRQLLDRARAAQVPWADRLAAVLPQLDELGTIPAEVGTSGLLLCHCALIPEHVRHGAGDDLVIGAWTFAGSLTPELEVASQLQQWACRPSLSAAAATAFLDGYREVAGSCPPLRPESFAVAVSGYLNWVHGTVCDAVSAVERTDDDAGDRDLSVGGSTTRAADAVDLAEREVLDLLSHPFTRADVDRLVVLSHQS